MEAQSPFATFPTDPEIVKGCIWASMMARTARDNLTFNIDLSPLGCFEMRRPFRFLAVVISWLWKPGQACYKKGAGSKENVALSRHSILWER